MMYSDAADRSYTVLVGFRTVYGQVGPTWVGSELFMDETWTDSGWIGSVPWQVGIESQVNHSWVAVGM